MSNCKKLLAGLEGAGISVTVRDVAKFMASNGVLVTPSIGRRRAYVSIDEKTFGVDIADFGEEGGAFYRERAYAGHLNFIPPKDEAVLGRLEKRLRRAVEKRSLAEGFMPMRAYDSLKEEFEEIRKDYFDQRDAILAKWQMLLNTFAEGAAKMLNGIKMPNAQREQLLKQFMAAVPSEEEYKNSFSMTLRVHAFPAQCELEGLDSSVAADVQRTWRDDVVTTAITAIEALIGTIWAKAGTALKQYLKSGNIKTSTINALASAVEELEWKNVFRNPMLTEAGKMLKGIETMTINNQAEVLEAVMTNIYGYAKDAKMDLNVDDSPYTMAQLETMVKVKAA